MVCIVKPTYINSVHWVGITHLGAELGTTYAKYLSNCHVYKAKGITAL
jgi:hypothetical protein